MRNTLVTALVSCAEVPLRTDARRFLRGLSSDELQFIAEFLGACILAGSECHCRREFALQLAKFQWRCLQGKREDVADREHKLILLLEYLNRAGAPGLQQAVN